jgi:hypothetical protein
MFNSLRKPDIVLLNSTQYADVHTLLRGPDLHPRFLAGTLRMLHMDLMLAINVTVHKHALEHTATARTALTSAEMWTLCHRNCGTGTSVGEQPVVDIVALVIHQLRYWLYCRRSLVW